MLMSEMNREQLEEFKEDVQREYDGYKALGLSLNMARGKPGYDQLQICAPMLDCLKAADFPLIDSNYFNYGMLDGIPEAKTFFSKMLGVGHDDVVIFGNSSLKVMYDNISRCYNFGAVKGEKPWKDQGKLKWLCPVPGYDRHFAITEEFGFEMINIPTDENGPDMDMVEKLVSEDPSVKGIWCVPMYSNPTGITYSDEVVRRMANLSPAAKDFRIFWDNAYCIHHLTEDHDTLLNIFDEAKKSGKEDMILEFASTSKVTFPGSGVAIMAASEPNIKAHLDVMNLYTIGYDKLNMLRHVKFFDGKIENLSAHMKKFAKVLAPRFNAVIKTLDAKIAPLGIGSYNKPKGGYFVSFDAMPGCAKRIVQLCKEAGVTLTGAGATYPYGVDPDDKNIRIAPTFPTVEELQKAMDIFAASVKLASAEKLLSE